MYNGQYDSHHVTMYNGQYDSHHVTMYNGQYNSHHVTMYNGGGHSLPSSGQCVRDDATVPQSVGLATPWTLDFEHGASQDWHHPPPHPQSSTGREYMARDTKRLVSVDCLKRCHWHYAVLVLTHRCHWPATTALVSKRTSHNLRWTRFTRQRERRGVDWLEVPDNAASRSTGGQGSSPNIARPSSHAL
ncbi:hypothetical protein ACOMHN_009582 [Nucella lapillus]